MTHADIEVAFFLLGSITASLAIISMRLADIRDHLKRIARRQPAEGPPVNCPAVLGLRPAPLGGSS